jgi:hypothetical protein
VVEAVWLSDPDVPVTVNERAYGAASEVVVMVRIDVPLPMIEGGLNPPLAMPAGKPDSLVTPRDAVPLKPLSDVTVTVNDAD